jgi:hypothetical protein
MVTKWISIKSVLDTLQDTISPDFWNEQIVIEHCARAMDMIGAVVQYEDDIKFIRVSNHKACLPKGLLQINQIAYKRNFSLDASDKENINRLLGIDNEIFMQGSSLWTGTIFFNSDYYYRQWLPLHLSTNTFALSVHCDNSVNIGCKCDYEYTVSPDGTITTSFKDGIICISYKRYPLDCDGELLIPDSEYYKEALRAYTMMRIWEFRMNMKEEGAERLYMMYRDLWSLMKGKAVGDIRDPDLGEMENIKNIQIALIPKTRRFAGFFGNLNKEENLRF